MANKKNTVVFEGNSAKGYTSTDNGITIRVQTEQAARTLGVIKNDVPTWAKCCGWGGRK